MTTLQVLCRYGDDPSVGNFWVTMEELADALSAAPVNLPDVPDAVPPLYQTYKWRVDAIGGHHDNYVHGALHTSAAIPVSGDTHKQVLDALAAMTQRAEQAEREANSWIQAADDERTKLRHALAIARGRAEAAEAAARAKGDEWAQSIQHATVFRERWEAAEAKLAAIPLDALLYCFRTEIEEREFEDWEQYSSAIQIWIDTIVADRLAQLRPSKEAQP